MPSTSNLGVSQIIRVDGTEKYDDYKVDASEHIYEGDFVSVNPATGYAHKLVAGEAFLGLAVREVYNIGSGYDPARSGTGAAGSTSVRVLTKGNIKKAVTDGAGSLVPNLTDLGTTVYATDDRTVNTTVGSNTAIGKLANLEADGQWIIAIEAAAERSI